MLGDLRAEVIAKLLTDQDGHTALSLADRALALVDWRLHPVPRPVPRSQETSVPHGPPDTSCLRLHRLTGRRG